MLRQPLENWKPLLVNHLGRVKINAVLCYLYMQAKGIHMGGATQILFGIRGSRWDRMPFFQQLYNEYWIRPLAQETPANFKKVERGCYW